MSTIFDNTTLGQRRQTAESQAARHAARAAHYQRVVDTTSGDLREHALRALAHELQQAVQWERLGLDLTLQINALDELFAR